MADNARRWRVVYGQNTGRATPAVAMAVDVIDEPSETAFVAEQLLKVVSVLLLLLLVRGHAVASIECELWHFGEIVRSPAGSQTNCLTLHDCNVEV